MGRPIVWACDQCGTETREGEPGCPPTGWIRVEVHTMGYLRVDGDFCPVCSKALDVAALALTGKRPIQPKPRTRKKETDLSLLEDNGAEEDL